MRKEGEGRSEGGGGGYTKGEGEGMENPVMHRDDSDL